MVLAERQLELKTEFMYPPLLAVAEAQLLLAEFTPHYRAQVEIAAFITQHHVPNLPALNADPQLLLRAGWYRHTTFPDLFVPPGFFKDKKYYLTIACQITGEKFEFLRNERYQMLHEMTRELLFVGAAGKVYLENRGWKLLKKG